MQNLKLFTSKDLHSFLKTRKGETKLGEAVQLISNLTTIYDDIATLDVTYVIFGISEDIGVTANYGKTGTYKAWEAAVKVLLNTQSNHFIDAKNILILGNLEYPKEQKHLENEELSDKKKTKLAREFVTKIDADVVHLVHTIVKAGKIPIIIGGGHNNAYGNIKGTSLALNKKINAVNFDAHHDFRKLEGRHSGNGFSYAHHEGFLKKYFIFGLHENYISQNDLENLTATKDLIFSTFEDISIRKKLKFNTEIKRALKHISDANFGIEIDCDAIENIPSSAATPSGFSVNKARQFVSKVASDKNASYLHICEAAPNSLAENQVGKLISYLITDFIKAHENQNS